MKRTILHLAPLDRNVGDNALNLAIRAMLGQAFNVRHMGLVGWKPKIDLRTGLERTIEYFDSHLGSKSAVT